MRKITNPIRLSEAMALIKANRTKPKLETVGLDHALGLRLAKPIVANATLPSADVSAMDGYAVKFEDVQSVGAKLEVVGTSPAGKPYLGAISTGQAVRIYTGGVVPDGADHILIQEMSKADGNKITVTEPQVRRRHIRKAGQDFRRGQIVLAAGLRLGPADLGMIAAANVAQVSLVKPLRVAILTNGNELRAPGAELKAGELVNSNGYALAALCRVWGAEPTLFPPSKDTIESVIQSVKSASDHDVILIIGGASVGDFDIVKPAFDEMGVERLFAGIALRPGKPTWFGVLDQTPVLGLPGNPVAAYVSANLLLACLLGNFDDIPYQSAITSEDLDSNGERESFLLAIADSQDGHTVVQTLNARDTSLTTSLARANCLLHRNPHADAQKQGELVSIVRLN